jgi:hypothetical protein
MTSFEHAVSISSEKEERIARTRKRRKGMELYVRERGFLEG